MSEKHKVRVTAEWETEDTFEFDTAEEAKAFADRVNGGGSDGLDAITEQGDIRADNGSLINWRAS